MTGLQWLGAALLAAVLLALFILTARLLGWRPALAIWGGSFLLTGLVVLATGLLTGAIS